MDPSSGAVGGPVPARRAGVFVVELRPPAGAPTDRADPGRQVGRACHDLTLDGGRPTSKALVARLAAFWLPSQAVLYVASTTVSIGGRWRRPADAARRPPAHAGGHWLATLDGHPSMRVWWTATDAVEEYEDALLTPSRRSVPATTAAWRPARQSVVLPLANLRRPTGERRASGLAGSLLAEVARPAPPTRVVVLPDGDAEGARGEPPSGRRGLGPRFGRLRGGASGAPDVDARASITGRRHAYGGRAARLRAELRSSSRCAAPRSSRGFDREGARRSAGERRLHGGA